MTFHEFTTSFDGNFDIDTETGAIIDYYTERRLVRRDARHKFDMSGESLFVHCIDPAYARQRFNAEKWTLDDEDKALLKSIEQRHISPESGVAQMKVEIGIK